jgi:hypothetical protein
MIRQTKEDDKRPLRQPRDNNKRRPPLLRDDEELVRLTFPGHNHHEDIAFARELSLGESWLQ